MNPYYPFQGPPLVALVPPVMVPNLPLMLVNPHLLFKDECMLNKMYPTPQSNTNNKKKNKGNGKQNTNAITNGIKGTKTTT
jgi:hypothetical protein